MNIFLVGPSSIGKSAMAKAACDGKEMLHINLDNLVSARNRNSNLGTLIQQNGDQWLWAEYQKIIEETISRYKFHQKKLIFDLRASVLSLPEARTFLSTQFTVALTASPGEVFVKVQKWGRKISYMDWEQIEYSPERRDFYDACQLKIDISDLTEPEAIDKLKSAIENIGKEPLQTQAAPEADTQPEEQAVESGPEPESEETGPEITVKMIEPPGEAGAPQPTEAAAPAPSPIPESQPAQPEDFDFVSDPKNKAAARPKAEPSKAPASPGLSAPFSKVPQKKKPIPKQAKPWPREERQAIPRKNILGALGIVAAIFVVMLAYKFYYYPSHASEGEQNLIILQEREKQYYAINHKYATSFAELGWQPSGVRYYAYFMSPTEVTQPGWIRYALPQGITASVSQTGYTFVAVGKLHTDKGMDVWAIKPDSKPQHLRKD